jgi:toxin FitB
VNGFLTDTNVISEFVRPRPNLEVIRWLEAADPDSLFASVITIGEIRLGIEDLPPSRKRMQLEQWLEERLPNWFESHLLPVTRAIAEQWGRITIQAKKKGEPLATADGLIAAAALEHNLTVVTRNVKDFAGTGVGLFDPWNS